MLIERRYLNFQLIWLDGLNFDRIFFPSLSCIMHHHHRRFIIDNCYLNVRIHFTGMKTYCALPIY